MPSAAHIPSGPIFSHTWNGIPREFSLVHKPAHEKREEKEERTPKGTLPSSPSRKKNRGSNLLSHP
ncbi:hypothetical protein, partial [Nocardiopsis sp. ATB16-24]|uniref:hypothetical protein n=1 Tax=Nocardiopsis sp. ATB16-24 TaxID=3019555 RepID=UPI0025555965